MRISIDTRPLLDVGWWHWAITLPLLAVHVALGTERARPAIEIASGLCLAVAVYGAWRAGSAGAPAVQVRLAYLALLILGLAPAARWVHWVQLAGTSAMVTVGYCPLARLLTLMPWNRDEPLTARLVWETFAAPPGPGGILRLLAPLESTTDCHTGVGGALPACSP
jgi:hypothetical protein